MASTPYLVVQHLHGEVALRWQARQRLAEHEQIAQQPRYLLLHAVAREGAGAAEIHLRAEPGGWSGQGEVWYSWRRLGVARRQRRGRVCLDL